MRDSKGFDFWINVGNRKVVSEDLKKFVIKAIYSKSMQLQLQELNLMLQIDHPKIIRVFDFREINTGLFVLMEYMNGKTLQDVICKVKKIKENYLKLIIFQVLQGLVFLHCEKKISHLNIRPSNLLFNLKGECKIAEFGLSGLMTDTMDDKYTYLGKKKYMSPERIIGLKHGIESDIWSLGVIVFECYYDKSMFLYENQIDLVETYKGFSVPKDGPEDLNDFIMGCMKYKPEERYTASELLLHPWMLMSRNIEMDGKINEFTFRYLCKIFKSKK